MCTPRLMVIKMSKMAHFLYFLLMTAKNESLFGQNLVLFSSIKKLYVFLGPEPPLSRCQALTLRAAWRWTPLPPGQYFAII